MNAITQLSLNRSPITVEAGFRTPFYFEVNFAPNGQLEGRAVFCASLSKLWLGDLFRHYLHDRSAPPL